MAIILETERLISGEFTHEDAAFILNLLNTEGWLKYIGERNVKTLEQARTYLLNGPLKNNENPFVSLNRVALKSDNSAIGLVSLIQRDNLPFIDIGFAFLPVYMGNGYAFEIVSEVINYAFREYKLEKILAITLPHNRSSIRIIEKLGMKIETEYIKPETNEILLQYVLTNIHPK